MEFGRSVQSNHDYCQSSPDMSQSVVGKFRSFYTTIDQVLYSILPTGNRLLCVISLLHCKKKLAIYLFLQCGGLVSTWIKFTPECVH